MKQFPWTYDVCMTSWVPCSFFHDVCIQKSKAFVLESCCYWGCYQHLQLKNNFNTKKQLILCAVSFLRAGRGQVCGSQQVETKSIERHGNKRGFQRPTFETSFRGGKLSWVAPFWFWPDFVITRFHCISLVFGYLFFEEISKTCVP